MDAEEFTARHPNLKNRRKWHHGFSQCRICQAKLMAYLEKGHSFDEVIAKLKESHPDIKNPRIFARNVIRETTGLGIFDDYIFEHQLWGLRNPILSPPEIRQDLENRWSELAAEGKKLIEKDRRVTEALEKGDEISALLKYVMGRRRDAKRGKR